MIRWHHPEELKRLDMALMEREDCNDYITTLSELDGFCTGLILCPEMIPCDQWQKEIWGKDRELDLQSLEYFESLMGLVMDHCDRIAAQLADPDHYRPLMQYNRETDTLVVDEWVRGFVRAACLCPEVWETFLQSADGKTQVAFSLLLELAVLGTSESRLKASEQSELLLKAPKLIPKLVLELNEVRTAPLITRSASIIKFPSLMTLSCSGAGQWAHNLVCHCGSGRQHRRCCGSN